MSVSLSDNKSSGVVSSNCIIAFCLALVLDVGIVGSVLTLTAGALTIGALAVVVLVTVVWTFFLGLPLCPVSYVA